MSPPVPAYRKSLFALVLAMFSMAMGVGFIVPLLPVYAENMGASGAWIGMIFAADPLFRAIFMVLFGALSDRKGKRKVMQVGLSGYVLVSLGFVAAGTVGHLLLLRILQGLCSAMVGPVSRAYAGEISPANREGEVMGYLNMGFFLGFAGGPLVGGLLADAFGLNVPFYAMGIITGAALLLVTLFVPEQTPSRVSTDILSLNLVVDSVGLLRIRLVAGAVALRSAVGIGHGVFSTLLPLIAQLTLGLTAAQVGLVVTVRSLVAAALQPKGGYLADNFNRRWVGLLGSLLLPIGFIAIPLSQGFWHLLATSVIIGAGFGISVPAAEAMAVERGREHGMGSIMGLNEMCRSLAMAAGALLGGSSLDYTGALNAHIIAAAVSVLGLVGAMWLLRAYRPPNARRTGLVSPD